jgi:hypothetical protein
MTFVAFATVAYQDGTIAKVPLTPLQYYCPGGYEEKVIWSNFDTRPSNQSQ